MENQIQYLLWKCIYIYKMKIIDHLKIVSKMIVKMAHAHKEETKKTAADKSKALVIE